MSFRQSESGYGNRKHLTTRHFCVCSLLDTALLEWVSQRTVRAYTTPDSAVSYLNDAYIAWTTPSFAL